MEAEMGSGGGHLIRGNTINDNGLCGIAGWNHRGTRIIDNTVLRNNRLGYRPGFDANWEEHAGIKLHGADALIEGNLVCDNNGAGIWVDNGFTNARITRNIVLNNARCGVFLELGKGPCLVDNNIIGVSTGDGVYAHDASGITVAHNLIFANAGFGVWMRNVSTRKAGGKIVETSRERIYGNILLNNSRGAIGLPYESKRATDNNSNFNVISMHGPALPFHIPWSHGCTDGKTVGKELQKALEDAGGNTSEHPNWKVWPKRRVLDLKQWQLLMGMDQGSTMAKGAIGIDFRRNVMTLRVNAKKELLAVSCPVIEGVENDYWGKPMPKDGRIPGPFQGLKEGNNGFVLKR